MIPIHPEDASGPCRPVWVHLNHLLSYCTRQVQPALAQDTEMDETPRCTRPACLFSAARR